jgi:HTH-type transcriptional regulator, glycine betaine synthesis regulator
MNAIHAKPAPVLGRTRLDMVEACGRIGQVFGLPRSLGQIYGLLYLSPAPLSLDDIAELLGISKASASTGTRQLAAWGGIRQVWVHGDRRDHFEAEPELGNLLRSGYSDFLKPRLASSQKRLDRLTATLDQDLAAGLVTREEYRLCLERLKKFAHLQKKLQALAPLADKLF